MPSKERQKTRFATDVDVGGDAAITGTLAVTGDTTLSGALDVTGVLNGASLQPTATAVTATADGLTTGLIALGTSFASITSASADNVARLPAGNTADVGMEVWGWVGANGCELRTEVGASATINGVDCDDSANEAAIPATSLFMAKLVAADTWILHAWTELGATITAIVPDAQ